MLGAGFKFQGNLLKIGKVGLEDLVMILGSTLFSNC